MGDVMGVKKDYDLTEMTRLLLKMRDNCERKEGELYDDPERAEKSDALNAAIDIINNPSYVAAGDLISRSMLLENLKLLAKFQPEYKQSTILGVCATIRATPAVDAEPVRLRIDVSDVDEEKGWYRRLLYCPCGQLIKTETWDAKRCVGTGTVLRENKMPKHCPNCGAKMNGGLENED